MEPEVREQLLDTWAIHARVVLYVLGAVDPAALPVDGLRGRSVGRQYAHIHNVRLLWLQSAAPDLLTGLGKFDTDQVPDPAELALALKASGAAVGELIARGLGSGRIKGFKPHPVAFLGYLIAHESFHQGDIGLRLSESGYPLAQKTAYGMWEWGTR